MSALVLAKPKAPAGQASLIPPPPKKKHTQHNITRRHQNNTVQNDVLSSRTSSARTGRPAGRTCQTQPAPPTSACRAPLRRPPRTSTTKDSANDPKNKNKNPSDCSLNSLRRQWRRGLFSLARALSLAILRSRSASRLPTHRPARAHHKPARAHYTPTRAHHYGLCTTLHARSAMLMLTGPSSFWTPFCTSVSAWGYLVVGGVSGGTGRAGRWGECARACVRA